RRAEAAEQRLPVGGRRRLVEESLELRRAIALAGPVGDRFGDARLPRFHVLRDCGGDIGQEALEFVRRRRPGRAVRGGALRLRQVAEDGEDVLRLDLFAASRLERNERGERSLKLADVAEL